MPVNNVNKWECNYEYGQWVLYRNGEPYEWFKDVLPKDVQDVLDYVREVAFYMENRTGEYWNENNGGDELIDTMFSAVCDRHNIR